MKTKHTTQTKRKKKRRRRWQNELFTLSLFELFFFAHSRAVCFCCTFTATGCVFHNFHVFSPLEICKWALHENFTWLFAGLSNIFKHTHTASLHKDYKHVHKHTHTHTQTNTHTQANSTQVRAIAAAAAALVLLFASASFAFAYLLCFGTNSFMFFNYAPDSVIFKLCFLLMRIRMLHFLCAQKTMRKIIYFMCYFWNKRSGRSRDLLARSSNWNWAQPLDLEWATATAQY